MSSWKTLPSARQGVKAVWETLPPGPYVVEEQHSNIFSNKTFEYAWSATRFVKFTFRLETENDLLSALTSERLYGTRVYASVAGRAEIVAYHYDSTD